jgi:hypothetical protein
MDQIPEAYDYEYNFQYALHNLKNTVEFILSMKLSSCSSDQGLKLMIRAWATCTLVGSGVSFTPHFIE